MNQTILKAKDLLKELEGCYLKPQKCPAGKWTIGYGHNLEANRLTAEDMKNATLDEDIIPAKASGCK